ncbi:spermidine synthase [Herbiconiux sp. A18JL235]|uniref:Spermidine synthase n=1 Tax=Herbiconiux sp. A18JL235 TaxID=3152363 RepID=A0AB39BFK9_9MICO
MARERDRRGTRVEHPSARLSDGMLATIEPDRFRAGSQVLIVDGTPQSHVDLDDPTYLSFEYVRRIGHGIDLLAPAGEAITAVHLGGGAFTLPRYVEATRPGSRQQVVEIDSGLVEFVRRELPLPRSASIRVRHGDAREVLEKLPTGILGAVDLVVVDVFAGARTPAHVTSAEFYRAVAGVLAPHGLVAVNVADGAGLAFARSQAATLAHVFPSVAVAADPQMLKAKRFGNVVAFASASELPFDTMPRLLAGDPVAAKLVTGRELENFIAGAAVATDQTATRSPAPARSVFAVDRRAAE